MKTIQHTRQPLSSQQLAQRAQTGGAGDIMFIMEKLSVNSPFLHQKMIDYALGLVVSDEGRQQIKHYLFNGNQIQRNYAALYFKRLGFNWIIDEAVQQGSIDEIQAYSR